MAQALAGIHLKGFHMADPIGPVEVIMIDFEGNRFNGDIAPALFDLVDRGIVRIIDLSLIIKDEDGDATIYESQELSPEVAAALEKLSPDMAGLMSEEDILDLAAEMPANSTALTMLVEHKWATDFARAVRASGGELVMAQRIPGDLVDAAREGLLEAARNH
jgi:hypothetical protein